MHTNAQENEIKLLKIVHQINPKKNVLYYYKHTFISGNEDNNKLQAHQASVFDGLLDIVILKDSGVSRCEKNWPV